jgi:hypothetical protein
LSSISQNILENGTKLEAIVDISVALSPCDIETDPNLAEDIASLEHNLPHNHVELLEKACFLI